MDLDISLRNKPKITCDVCIIFVANIVNGVAWPHLDPFTGRVCVVVGRRPHRVQDVRLSFVHVRIPKKKIRTTALNKMFKVVDQIYIFL